MKKLISLFILTAALGFSWAQADDQNQNPENFVLHTDHSEQCSTQSDPRTQLECWAPKQCPVGYDATASYCDDDAVSSWHACGYECRSAYIQH